MVLQIKLLLHATPLELHGHSGGICRIDDWNVIKADAGVPGHEVLAV